jgi:hypothetical protein
MVFRDKLERKKSVKFNFELSLGLWGLMPLSTIFQLYRENHRPAADHSLRCALKKITKLKTGIKCQHPAP